MRKGFIVPLLLILIATYAAYYLYKNYAKTPNAQTTEASQNFLKYPNAQNWTLKNLKNFCIQKERCSEPITITFESYDAWNQIYVFYKEALPQYGWQTNSMVLTSIPDGAVFTNSQNCEAYLSKNSIGFLGLQKQDNGKFSIKVTCK